MQVNDIYYIVISVTTTLGTVYGAVKLYNRQRDRWTQEGRQRAEGAALVKQNSDRLSENTNAIAALTRELREFVTSVRAELSSHEGRISRLERWREGHGSRSEGGRQP